MIEWTDEKRREVHRRMTENAHYETSVQVQVYKEHSELYMNQRESARRAIMAALDCVEEGELEAAIDILQEEKDSW